MTASLNCIGNISLTLSLLMDVLKVLNISFNKNMLHDLISEAAVADSGGAPAGTRERDWGEEERP